MWLIQGFYCREDRVDIPICVPSEGIVTVARREVFTVMFAGVIRRSREGTLDTLVGEMIDYTGERSVLYNINIFPEVVTFEKRYLRPDGTLSSTKVRYRFEKQVNGTWCGEYRAEFPSDPVTGPSRCVFTKVQDTIFEHDQEWFARALTHSQR